MERDEGFKKRFLSQPWCLGFSLSSLLSQILFFNCVNLSKHLPKLKNLKLKPPKKKSWRKLILALNKKERLAFFGFFLLFLTGLIILFIDFYLVHTSIVPTSGGLLREGLIGHPRFINPIYAESNDIDRDLTNLIFSGLMKYDENGDVVCDIAKNYRIEQGKIYELELKNDVFFHDGTRLTAKDVIFTIKTIQNPDFKSPLLAKWLGVDIESESDYQIRFNLKNPYPGFLENLTLKILPSHIWEKFSSQNFPLSPYNLEPIGSGPYRFRSFSKSNKGVINSIALEKNHNFYRKAPHINQIRFSFFDSEKDLISAANAGLIDTFSPISPENFSNESSTFQKYSFVLPRYFAIFFNSDKNSFFEKKTARIALAMATNNEEIQEKVLSGEGSVVISPFLPEIYQFKQPDDFINYDPATAKEKFITLGFKEEDGRLIRYEAEERMTFRKTLYVGSRGKDVENLQTCLAKFEDVYPEGKITGYFGSKTKAAVIRFQNKYPDDILRPAGIKTGNGKVGPATREKLNEVCVISPEITESFTVTLTTSNDPLLLEIAQTIKQQWEKLGIDTEIQDFEISQIKGEIIKERDYEMLLFGQVLGAIPDPFSFWHSSQRNYPGLNLANYKDTKLDKLLEEIRVEADIQERKDLLQKAQDILLEDVPAIFLCNPDYIYFASEKIKGLKPGLIVDPSKRFNNISNWYIKTSRRFTH